MNKYVQKSKTRFNNKSKLVFIISLLLNFSFTFLVHQKPMANKQEEASQIETLDDLKLEIEKILRNTNTPAVGIALIDGNGSQWIGSIGKANVEDNIDADENTMYRIGSTSKIFVSLAILKLQQEGLISLKNKVKDLVPEIEYENKWEASSPILVEHLLEHTTGWDDIHIAEYAHNDPNPTSLKEALDFHPDSRISRWIPGTRMSYCNSGPCVAAYIVEKITGETFEDYIKHNFFQPLGMEEMTYFASDAVRQHGATLYANGKAEKYWHYLLRASGSINASPKDMAKMLNFFINRGRVNDSQIISETSLKRMETPSTSLGAKAGMESGYGLNNYSSTHKSFIFRTHGGGVQGGNTSFSYLPKYNSGYVMMLNSGNISVYYKMNKLIRDYLTRNYSANDITPDTTLTKKHAQISGYYLPINPRSQITYFIERIINAQHVWYKNDSIFRKSLIEGQVYKYLPAKGCRYKRAESGLIDMVQAEDPLAGDVIHVNWEVLKQVSPILVYGQFILSALWLIMMLSSIIWGFFWLIRF